jgi:hypothetical protein
MKKVLLAYSMVSFVNRAYREGEMVATGSGASQVNSDAVSAGFKAVAIGAKGSVRESARVDMGAGHNDVNNILQFDIVNTGVGAINELVRIGSWLGEPDAYAQFNTTKSGADSVNGITDNFGVNLLKCQGFSKITVGTPTFIKTIKLISSDATQLATQFSHKTILPDFTIIPLIQNIAFTREKSDQATDLLVAKGSWLLSSRDFLEFTSLATKSISVIMELASISDVRQFVRF